MTPLATELVEDLLTRPGIYLRDKDMGQEKTRRVVWDAAHRCKFFDCAAVSQMALRLAMKMRDAYEDYDQYDLRLAFLPAEWTWVEVESPGIRDQADIDYAVMINEPVILDRPVNYTYRTGFVFHAPHGSTSTAKRYQISYETPRKPGTPRIWRVRELSIFPLANSGFQPQRYGAIRNASGEVRKFDKPVASIEDFYHYALLALINTPRVIGQVTHFPHHRIEREKLKRMKLIGKFPLRAWTEIILKVALPDDRGDEMTEGHLTGQRCLHYCRTYLRVRLGMLEYVEGHWRGDPALGMKRSRYRVEQ